MYPFAKRITFIAMSLLWITVIYPECSSAQIRGGGDVVYIYCNTPVSDTASVNTITLQGARQDCFILLKKIHRFKNLRSLKISWIDKSGSSAIPAIDSILLSAVDELPNLTSVTLQGLYTDRIPSFVFRIRGLQRLSIVGTLITELPEEILGMQKLMEIWYVGLTEFSRLDYSNKSKANCILSNRFFSVLCRMQSLEKLCFNKVTFADASFAIGSLGKLKQLKKLDIGNCSLNALPNEIGTLSHLECLILTNCASPIENRNNITRIPDALYRLKRLKQLSVETLPVNTTISQLKSKFPGCTITIGYQNMPAGRGW